MKNKNRLVGLIKNHALKKGNFILSSGKESNYFIDMSQLLYTSEGVHSVATNIFELIKDDERPDIYVSSYWRIRLAYLGILSQGILWVI
jgi:orotate phosphoribosyltransferase